MANCTYAVSNPFPMNESINERMTVLSEIYPECKLSSAVSVTCRAVTLHDAPIYIILSCYEDAGKTA